MFIWSRSPPKLPHLKYGCQRISHTQLWSIWRLIGIDRFKVFLESWKVNPSLAAVGSDQNEGFYLATNIMCDWYFFDGWCEQCINSSIRNVTIVNDVRSLGFTGNVLGHQYWIHVHRINRKYPQGKSMQKRTRCRFTECIWNWKIVTGQCIQVTKDFWDTFIFGNWWTWSIVDRNLDVLFGGRSVKMPVKSHGNSKMLNIYIAICRLCEIVW